MNPFFGLVFIFLILKTYKCQEKAEPSIFQLLRPRNTAKAQVYGSGDAKGREISNDVNFWADLSEMKKTGTKDPVKLCIKGTWILYEHADFIASSKQEVGIISGENSCGDLKEYGNISSLQPLSLAGSRKDDMLAFFPDKDFSGPVWPVDGSHTDTPDSPVSRSLITLGKQEWTLIPTEGDPICISPQGTDAFPVCFVPKLLDGEKIKSGQYLQVYKGCGESKSNKISLHFCIPYETPKIQRIDKLGTKMQGRAFSKKGGDGNSETNEEGCGTNSSSGSLDAEGKNLIRTRLTNDLISDENFLWPKNKSNVWKLELLERTFDVMFSTCPDEMVPDEYLALIREIYIFQWDRSMESGKKVNSSNIDIDDDEWIELILQLEDCAEKVADGFDEILEVSMVEFKSVQKPSQITRGLDPILKYREKYDHVIETVWLVANHVAATCHHALGFVGNFWTDYINMFQQMYFNPVETQWANPGKWNNAYKYVFGGYGIERMYNKIAICATTSLYMIDNLDPFHRTVDVDMKK